MASDLTDKAAGKWGICRAIWVIPDYACLPGIEKLCFVRLLASENGSDVIKAKSMSLSSKPLKKFLIKF